VADENGPIETLTKSGDEPFLIAHNFPRVPVVVSENRVAGAHYLENNFALDVIILDDGFQHRMLHRNLDILIVDFHVTQKPHLLPWGFLREGIQNIERADLLVYSKNGVQNNSENNLLFELDNHVYDHQNKMLIISELKGDYGLFAGLGKPEHFFKQVEDIHQRASVKISLPDHAQYTPQQLGEIKNNSCDYWITTQKDFIKLDPAFCEQFNIFFVSVKTTLPDPLLTHLKQHFN
jgi:tetraacyldisaccharide 4'-kinase